MEKYITKYMRDRRLKDPEFKKRTNRHQNISQLKRRIKRKANLYSILGGYECKCGGIDCWHKGKCVVSDKRVIQLDHINNDGYKDKVDKKGGMFIDYYFKHPLEAKRKLQPFCANCNWCKRYNLTI